VIPFGAGAEYVETPRHRARGTMTVGIGSICNHRRIPGAIMLGLDMRVTYTTQNVVLGKHDLTSKLFDLPFGFSGVVAGTMPHCETLISFLCEYLKNPAISLDDLQLDHIVFAARHAGEQIVLSLFDRALVNKLGMTRNEWIDRQSDSNLKSDGRALLAKVNPDVSCLIAGFIRSGPVLIRVVGKNLPEEIVSHSAIGIGAKFALEKLSARAQGPYCSIQRTALAFSEGLRYAKRKSDGYVGPPANCLVIEPGSFRQFAPQSELLRKWSRDIKISKTEVLDSEEYWKEFCQILTVVPRFSRQATS
jgi:hypothetical protein